MTEQPFGAGVIFERAFLLLCISNYRHVISPRTFKTLRRPSQQKIIAKQHAKLYFKIFLSELFVGPDRP